MSSRACASRPSRRATSPACERQGITVGLVTRRASSRVPAARNTSSASSWRSSCAATSPTAMYRHAETDRVPPSSVFAAPRRHRRAGRSRAARRRGSGSRVQVRLLPAPPRVDGGPRVLDHVADRSRPHELPRADLRCHGVPEHGPVASRHGERAPQGLGGLVVLVRPAQDADHLDERRRVVVEPVDERAARVQAADDRERLVARPSREEPEHHRVAQQRAFGRRLVRPSAMITSARRCASVARSGACIAAAR